MRTLLIFHRGGAENAAKIMATASLSKMEQYCTNMINTALLYLLGEREFYITKFIYIFFRENLVLVYGRHDTRENEEEKKR